jgi:23S rRNA pseudouridine1911/1915/1917 synthase
MTVHLKNSLRFMLKNMDTKKYKFIVEENKIRVDNYIKQKIPALTRTKIQNLIKSGYLKINEKIIYKPNKFIFFNDKIEFNEKLDSECNNVAPENIPLNIIYEDNFFAAINKPCGMITHPAGKLISGTLVNAILYHFGMENFKLNHSDLEPCRPGIVHRLDKDTSGIILIAKKPGIQSTLSEMFKNREIKKHYFALVNGTFNENKGIITYPIKRDAKNRKLMKINNKGKSCITEFEVIEQNNNSAFLKVNLKTGRTHQIRVHMKSINHPILGDVLYSSNTKNILRLMLHSYSLEFIHPVTHKNIFIKANPDDTFKKILRQMEINYKKFEFFY